MNSLDNLMEFVLFDTEAFLCSLFLAYKETPVQVTGFVVITSAYCWLLLKAIDAIRIREWLCTSWCQKFCSILQLRSGKWGNRLWTDLDQNSILFYIMHYVVVAIVSFVCFQIRGWGWGHKGLTRFGESVGWRDHGFFYMPRGITHRNKIYG